MSNSHGESLHEYIINNGITNIKSEYIRDDKTGYKRRHRKQGNEQEMKNATRAVLTNIIKSRPIMSKNEINK